MFESNLYYLLRGAFLKPLELYISWFQRITSLTVILHARSPTSSFLLPSLTSLLWRYSEQKQMACEKGNSWISFLNTLSLSQQYRVGAISILGFLLLIVSLMYPLVPFTQGLLKEWEDALCWDLGQDSNAREWNLCGQPRIEQFMWNINREFQRVSLSDSGEITINIVYLYELFTALMKQ